ncbi:Serpentine Receptor, class BC (Class B-like) [Caenorhabditis elegans]|uniref:Serpentine Receptor, class BC (Class B-like) n=1 Tax=Caenorhabditis elegans TaxID=6239 RepID=O61938_CAEEL|nr:Serpentine Receptor, class BC (Class B-like) [Caenorhabditis elegans]CCD63569.1 Serpentine Receptor, class BC (Class B-like) [Caenorhabditis elegans]|eukprot:NP_503986.1 Serpentine Receptor, class BC (class B-like) [Caenorhabditis elegans]
MSAITITCNSLSILFPIITCSINCYLIYSIFYSKRITWKSEFSLIYTRFAIDIVYTFFVPHNKIYYVLRQISDIFVMKNLTFYLVWPTIPLGAIRATLVLLITLDRVVASFFPIFYHNHRRRIPILAVISCVITFGLSDHIVLFEYCKYTVDVPLACDNFNCVINQCFFNYWSLRDQVQYFIIGVLSVLLCFRLFIWNNYVAIHANQVLSRATRIALLDSVIIFSFSIIPSFIFELLPTLSFASVGPWTIVFKHAGFMIESLIVCRLLFSEKVGRLVRRSTVITTY